MVGTTIINTATEMIVMVRFITLAWRNIQRNRRRTIITTSAIVVGVMMMVIVNGILTGMLERTIQNSVELETGHITIYAEGYHEKSDLMPLQPYIESYLQIVEIVNTVEGVAYVSPRVRARGSIQHGEEPAAVILNGIDPDLDPQVRDLNTNIVEGRYLTTEETGVMIGASLAEKLGIGVRDTVVIHTTAVDGSYSSVSREVTAVFNTGFSSYDVSMIFLSLPEIQSQLTLENDEVTEIVLMARDSGELEQLEDAVRQRLEEEDHMYEVLDWRQRTPELAEFVDMERNMVTFFLSIVLIISVIGILNTMLMAVYERVKEIGVMAAFGYTPRSILALFLLEGLVIGLIGASTGCILGAGITQYFSTVGIEFAGGAVVKFYETTVYPTLSTWDIFYPFLFAVGIAVLAALYPAHRASRLEPVEALRHV